MKETNTENNVETVDEVRLTPLPPRGTEIVWVALNASHIIICEMSNCEPCVWAGIGNENQATTFIT